MCWLHSDHNRRGSIPASPDQGCLADVQVVSLALIVSSFLSSSVNEMRIIFGYQFLDYTEVQRVCLLHMPPRVVPEPHCRCALKLNEDHKRQRMTSSVLCYLV